MRAAQHGSVLCEASGARGMQCKAWYVPAALSEGKLDEGTGTAHFLCASKKLAKKRKPDDCWMPRGKGEVDRKEFAEHKNTGEDESKVLQLMHAALAARRMSTSSLQQAKRRIIGKFLALKRRPEGPGVVQPGGADCRTSSKDCLGGGSECGSPCKHGRAISCRHGSF